ncbi:MAG: hypothetical protein COB98_03830 [Flavobacteriaceae bacterium]|nr:MAG: hypothetical protein COB98_03830 [Flavobacteriaceae bacterium]
MKRVIVKNKKLTPTILKLLIDKFPDGYGIRDIVRFSNAKGKYIEALEVQTEDIMYLVIADNALERTILQFLEDE